MACMLTHPCAIVQEQGGAGDTQNSSMPASSPGQPSAASAQTSCAALPPQTQPLPPSSHPDPTATVSQAAEPGSSLPGVHGVSESCEMVPDSDDEQAESSPQQVAADQVQQPAGTVASQQHSSAAPATRLASEEESQQAADHAVQPQPGDLEPAKLSMQAALQRPENAPEQMAAVPSINGGVDSTPGIAVAGEQLDFSQVWQLMPGR